MVPSPFITLLFPLVFLFFFLFKGLYADFTYFFIFPISVTSGLSSASERPGASYHSCLSLKVKLHLFFSLLLGITPNVCISCFPFLLSLISYFISFLSIYPSSLPPLLQALSSSPLRLILNYHITSHRNIISTISLSSACPYVLV